MAPLFLVQTNIRFMRRIATDGIIVTDQELFVTLELLIRLVTIQRGGPRFKSRFPICLTPMG